MKDFKTVNELSLEESFKIIQQGYDNPMYDQVKQHYESEINQLKIEERKDFESCTNSTDYKKFLAKFDHYSEFYKMQYKKMAENKIETLSSLNTKTGVEESIHGEYKLSGGQIVMLSICALFCIIGGICALFMTPGNWLADIFLIVLGFFLVGGLFCLK